MSHSHVKNIHRFLRTYIAWVLSIYECLLSFNYIFLKCTFTLFYPIKLMHSHGMDPFFKVDIGSTTFRFRVGSVAKQTILSQDPAPI